MSEKRMRIWKYQMHVWDEFSLTLPIGAKILAVQATSDIAIHAWMLVDADQTLEDRRFRVVGTGHPIDDIDQLTYLDSVQLHGGGFVFHVFEKELS